MNKILLSFLIVSFHVLAIAAEKVGNMPSEARLRELLRKSETAYSLATTHLGVFQSSRVNSLTNRIQDDQRVIQQTIRDTARIKDLEVPEKTVTIVSDPINEQDYLERQLSLHREMLVIVSSSSSPVLRNMEKRLTNSYENVKKNRDNPVRASKVKLKIKRNRSKKADI